VLLYDFFRSFFIILQIDGSIMYGYYDEDYFYKIFVKQGRDAWPRALPEWRFA
jgi:hypothetical protein